MTYPPTSVPSAISAVSRVTRAPVEISERYWERRPASTISPVFFWLVAMTSVSQASLSACASSFSLIFCEPASPGPVPTTRTFHPGFCSSKRGPR